MHTAARLALVLLAAAVPTAGAAQPHPLEMTAIYDPPRGESRVSVTVTSGAGMDLYFFTTHPDSVPAGPMERFQLVVRASRQYFASPRFTGVDEATLVLDDSVEIGLEGAYRLSAGAEVVTLEVSLDQARALGAARSVLARVGPWEVRLGTDEIARIGRLLAFARRDPDAPVPYRFTRAPAGMEGTYQIRRP